MKLGCVIQGTFRVFSNCSYVCIASVLPLLSLFYKYGGKIRGLILVITNQPVHSLVTQDRTTWFCKEDSGQRRGQKQKAWDLLQRYFYPAVWPWTTYGIFLSLSFLIYKIRASDWSLRDLRASRGKRISDWTYLGRRAQVIPLSDPCLQSTVKALQALVKAVAQEDVCGSSWWVVVPSAGVKCWHCWGKEAAHGGRFHSCPGKGEV